MSWSGHCEVIGPQTQQQPPQKSALYEVVVVMARKVDSSAEKVIARFPSVTGVHPCCRTRCRTLSRRRPDDDQTTSSSSCSSFSSSYPACTVLPQMLGLHHGKRGWNGCPAHTSCGAATARAMRVYGENQGDVLEHAGRGACWVDRLLGRFYALGFLPSQSFNSRLHAAQHSTSGWSPAGMTLHLCSRNHGLI